MKTGRFVLMVVLTLAMAAYSYPQEQKENLSVVGGWMQFTDAPNSLYHHLTAEAFKLLDLRRNRLARLSTEAEWRSRQDEIRATFQRVVGPFPPRTPLNARVTGVVQEEGYRFEKILFESMPNFFVTGVLFVPDGLKGKAPAVLYVCGHAATGFRNEPYMRVILNLVKKGFVVFAMDPVGQGERIQYWDPERNESRVGGPTLEHSYPGGQCFLSGYSPAKYMVWDGMRAIDYLLTRKEVDGARLGVTGRSGGGTQSAYIGAMDERIKAAAPENYITTFRRLLESRGFQDAEQNFYHGIVSGIDMPDLLIVRAPRPTLMITTTRDMFSIQGAREVFREVAPAFRAYGKEDNFSMVEDDAPHASTKKNREALYAFMRKALDLPGGTADEDVEIMPFEELNVTEKGQLATSVKGKKMFDLNATEIRRSLSELQQVRSKREAHRTEVLAAARELSGFRPPQQIGEAVFTGRWQRDGYAVEMFYLPGEGNYIIPFLVFVPQGGGRHPALIYLNSEGKATDAGPGGMIESLVKQGYLVLAPDLIGLGEVGPGQYRGDAYNFKMGRAPFNLWFAAIQIGRSLTGIRAGDVVRTARYLGTRADADVSRLSAVSRGELGAALLHAAAFDESIRQVVLLDPLVSWSMLVENEYYAPRYMPHSVPGAVGRYDLPDLAATLAPRRLLVLGGVNQQGEPVEGRLLEKESAVVRGLYSAREAGSAFETRPVPHNLGESVGAWLKAAR